MGLVSLMQRTKMCKSLGKSRSGFSCTNTDNLDQLRNLTELSRRAPVKVVVSICWLFLPPSLDIWECMSERNAISTVEGFFFLDSLYNTMGKVAFSLGGTVLSVCWAMKYIVGYTTHSPIHHFFAPTHCKVINCGHCLYLPKLQRSQPLFGSSLYHNLLWVFKLKPFSMFTLSWWIKYNIHFHSTQTINITLVVSFAHLCSFNFLFIAQRLLWFNSKFHNFQQWQVKIKLSTEGVSWYRRCHRLTARGSCLLLPGGHSRFLPPSLAPY